MSVYLAQLRAFVGRLSVRQRLTLGAVVLGGAALIGGVAYWASRPDYALLFGGLDAEDAARVVEQLQSEGTVYDLREGGTAIFVPREDVYELRLRFAGEGLVSDGPTGFELFDRGTLGMTDFMQKVSYQRAMEGELARTIGSVRGVEGARVHLVLPERSPFREDAAKPTASVVLNLAGGTRLDREQVEGITALVAGAVEGLDPAEVTVLDSRGELLSHPAQAGDASLTSTQLNHQRAVEEHLTQQGQSLLDRVLGPGRAVVRIAAALDFDETVTETERIDPESQTAISEEHMEENGDYTSATSTVRNYDLTRTHEVNRRDGGRVERLTVSVILDHRPPATPVAAAADGAEDAPSEPVPYTPEELREIEALVKNAVGFDEDRGDRITVQQARFDTSGDDALAAGWEAQRRDERLQLYLRYGLMALALLVGAWLLRAATTRVSGLAEPAATPASAPSGEAEEEGSRPDAPLPTHRREDAKRIEAVVEDFYTSRLSPDARARLNAKRQFYEATQAMVAEQPEEAAALIGTWIAEDRARMN